MAKNSMSTYVESEVVNSSDSETLARLRSYAIDKLQGEDGVELVSLNRTGDKLCATFTRNWETLDPKDKDEDEEEG